MEVDEYSLTSGDNVAKETLILIIGQGINDGIKTETKVILKMLLKNFKCVCVCV